MPRKNGNIRVVTYNLLADGIGFYGSRGDERSNGAIELLRAIDGDVIGLQEVSRWWFYCLNSGTDYSFVEPVRTEITGLMTVLAYNKRTLQLINSGNEPLKCGSNDKLRRLVWGVFESVEEDFRFCVINTHFNLSEADNSACFVQAYQVCSIVRDLQEEYACPVFALGDFNAKSRGAVSFCSSAVYEYILTQLSDVSNIAMSTSCGKDKNINGSYYDHIFAVGEIAVERYVLLSQKELRCLSDHYPIFADIVVE